MNTKIVLLIIIIVILLLCLFNNCSYGENFDSSVNLTASDEGCIDSGDIIAKFYAIGQKDNALYTKTDIKADWTLLDNKYQYTSFNKFGNMYVAVINLKTGISQNLNTGWTTPNPTAAFIFRYAKITPDPKYIILGMDKRIRTQTGFTDVSAPISTDAFTDLAYDPNTNQYIGVGLDGFLYKSPLLASGFTKITEPNSTLSIAVNGPNYYGIGNDYKTIWIKNNLAAPWAVAATSNIPISYINVINERRIPFGG
ncbi:MAG: hypothetical protein Harvfovirus8_24 [Harvfovirus sp.]|uniref:Uncharacterized protein n=1 Tax=Harvfovirus sp. TaxID=2487768 RepID=A0A3G5A4X4_9VIRU|nr:MAG: hypothetical protein Harvfovirus8_24 [Harvfovirus sp.]